MINNIIIIAKSELTNMIQACNKEKSESDRNQTHDLLNSRRALYPPSYENLWRARSFLKLSSCLTGVLHTARINIVEVIMSVVNE